MEYKLIVVAGEAKQKVIKIKPPTIIGRSRDADIPVGHSLVSRRHCEITVGEDGMLIVEDLGSLNGTYHGEQRISEPVYLEPGDTLTVGSITFQAVYGDFQPELNPPSAATKAKAKPEPAEDLPDFLANDAEEEDEAVEEAVEEIEERTESPDEADDADNEGFPDFEVEEKKTPAKPAGDKKRRPPPPVMDAADSEDEIADLLDDEEIEEIDEVEEDAADFEVDAEAEDASLGDSNIPVGDDPSEEDSRLGDSGDADPGDSADIEAEVEVAAGDSRSGDSGSGMSWLTGDDDEEAQGSSDSGLDDFFKSL